MLHVEDGGLVCLVCRLSFSNVTGLQKYQPDKDLYGDWPNSDPAQPGEPLRELVRRAEPVLHLQWWQQIR